MPRVAALEAARAGRTVWAAAIRGITDPALESVVDRTTWLDWGDLPGFFALLESWREAGVTEAVMAGKVEQRQVYAPDSVDGEPPGAVGDGASQGGGGSAIEAVVAGLPNAHTDELIGAVANVLEGAGIRLLSSIAYLGQFVAAEGVLSARPPTDDEERDIEHGWQIAKQLGGLDIGQTVVVKWRAVVAVEAMEGTDACIARAGALCGVGAAIVKVAKPNQDLRFDVPVVGRGTIEAMCSVGASVLAIEAGVTVLFDRDELVADANAAGIAVVARGNAVGAGERVPNAT